MIKQILVFISLFLVSGSYLAAMNDTTLDALFTHSFQLLVKDKFDGARSGFVTVLAQIHESKTLCKERVQAAILLVDKCKQAKRAYRQSPCEPSLITQQTSADTLLEPPIKKVPLRKRRSSTHIEPNYKRLYSNTQESTQKQLPDEYLALQSDHQLITSGNLYRDSKQYDLAQRCYQARIERTTSTDAALSSRAHAEFQLAEVLEKSGNIEQALHHYENVSQQDHNQSIALRARRALKNLKK